MSAAPPCACVPALRWRQSEPWDMERLYGYGVRVLVRTHSGPCALADQVLAAEIATVENKNPWDPRDDTPKEAVP